MKKLLFILLFICSAVLHAQVNGKYLVTDFGAVGDGQTFNTAAFQRAIDRASEKGGIVLVPPGRFVTGSLEFKSNVTLHVMKGATLLGSQHLSDYKEHVPELQSYNDIFLRYSLLYAEKAENISITGEGIIDGQGAAFPRTTKKKPDRYQNRPYLIRFVECRNVRVENVTLQNSAMWMQQYLACEFVTIRGIRVFNHANYNNDMMDIDGCRNVVVSDCFGDAQDDAITLKSTSNRITENVVISNCVVSSHCNGIKMGTESIGGFRNIAISNIIVKPSASDNVTAGFRNGISGITLAMVDGGVLDGVVINNIRIDGPQVPIFLRLGNRGRTVREEMKAPGVGGFRNVSLTNIIATNTGQYGCSITGMPGYPVENVMLSNIQITFKGGIDKPVNRIVPELANEYPECDMFGILPAYGFFVRHARGITFDNVVLRLENDDVRPAYFFDDVTDRQVK